MSPSITVILTCFNKEKFVQRSIESIINQKCEYDLDLLLIDDCSTDSSVKILEKYETMQPNISLIKNEENIGISLTGRKACSLVKGDYIARMDGDDYGTDTNKLQKQVKALEANPEYGWCTTDFDMTDLDGEIKFKDAIKNNYIPFIDSYEEMLALKGMTMASTGVCKKDLMLKANELANPDLLDDTFAIQLELFKHSKRYYLDESTTVYGRYQESDTHVSDERSKGLLKGQFEYADKYKDADFCKAFKLATKQAAHFQDIVEARESEIASLKQQITGLNKDTENLSELVNNIYNSRSWKLTKPIRSISGAIKKNNKIKITRCKTSTL